MCKWGTDKVIEIAGKKVAVDSCIAELILKLNKLGIKTTGCCCGHGKNPLYILFKLDGKVYEITEYKKKNEQKVKVIKATTKYKFCNHHREITKEQKIVDFGSGKFVADKIAIPLLKALNEIGLETRTHHVDENCGFVGIMIDNVDVQIRKISRERDADRTKYNNKYELLIRWDRKSKKRKVMDKIPKNKEREYRNLVIDILGVLTDINEELDSRGVSSKILEFQDKLKDLKEEEK